MSSLPTSIPSYITDIKEQSAKTFWTSAYSKAYQAQFNKYNEPCNGIKATMAIITAVALGIFASLTLSLWAAPLVLVVGTILAVDLMIGGSGICLCAYYCDKSEQARQDIKNLPTTFPIQFDSVYRCPTATIAQTVQVVPQYNHEMQKNYSANG